MFKTDLEKCKILQNIAFDSRFKFSAVRVEGAQNMTLIKGAPEKILPSAAA